MKRMIKLIVMILTSVGIAGSLQAGMVFSFSDNGSGTTKVAASYDVYLLGEVPSEINEKRSIGWDNLGSSGANDSTSLVADSDFFSFNEPNVGGVFSSYGITQGTTPLNVNGVNLSSLDMDGTAATFPYFVLWFEDVLPQSGIATASGSAVINFDFANLPYSVGDSVDLQGNGDVVFEFVAIPEPASAGLMVLIAGGLYFTRRFFAV